MVRLIAVTLRAVKRRSSLREFQRSYRDIAGACCNDRWPPASGGRSAQSARQRKTPFRLDTNSIAYLLGNVPSGELLTQCSPRIRVAEALNQRATSEPDPFDGQPDQGARIKNTAARVALRGTGRGTYRLEHPRF